MLLSVIKRRFTPVVMCMLLMAMSLSVAMVTAPPALANTDSLTVVPPSGSSAVTGETYGELAAAYWQTVLPIPLPTNPQNDPTGANCRGGNTTRIFFLAGTAAPSPPLVKRSCTVPTTKPIFFPIITGECSNLESGSFFGATPAARAACAKTLIDGVSIGSLKVTLDGVAVPLLGGFRAASPDFKFTIPAPSADNLLGVPCPGGQATCSGHSSADGFWVLLGPPPPGIHMIHFEASVASGPAAGFSQDVTYKLTVQ